ncbi:hypothetical protein UA32_04275 [Photobacterium angustum]|uniref:DUF1850 domain-containing protein n=1 Tax=Photobacterium angustum TaxID=661 RepID=A0ABX5H4Y5_PHOAN|nr:hypothetical protein [Photobacterium angustum]KJG39558.1 hypothetical protein UA32_04275 [Photobacterium angustum]PSX10475.1 hypothetical protein C0W27_10610 [Photobacterium angustum]
MKTIVLFIFSVCVFFYSNYVTFDHYGKDGVFISKLHVHSQSKGIWNSLIKLKFDHGDYTSDIYLEGSGIDDMAIFRDKGEILSYVDGQYTVHSDLQVLQQAKIINLKEADLYTRLLFASKQNFKPTFKIIYEDRNIFILEIGKNKQVQMFIRQE